MTHPEVYGRPLRHTLRGYWKLRVGDYRVVFKIKGAEVHILAIVHRKETYRVKQTGRPILVTRRGEPIAQILPPPPPERPKAWLGSFRGTGRILGDILSPAALEEEWEALR